MSFSVDTPPKIHFHLDDSQIKVVRVADHLKTAARRQPDTKIAVQEFISTLSCYLLAALAANDLAGIQRTSEALRDETAEFVAAIWEA